MKARAIDDEHLSLEEKRTIADNIARGKMEGTRQYKMIMDSSGEEEDEHVDDTIFDHLSRQWAIR